MSTVSKAGCRSLPERDEGDESEGGEPDVDAEASDASDDSADDGGGEGREDMGGKHKSGRLASADGRAFANRRDAGGFTDLARQ